jgi:undecaprenyl diphosphate synthase
MDITSPANLQSELTEQELLLSLDPDHLPRHVAVIMDGNGRWAASRGLPRIAGHREGLSALRDVINFFNELNIPMLTIYAFSHENWNRPKPEITLLMSLLDQFLQKERQTFQDRKMRFLPIGRLSALPDSVQALVHEVANETAHFTDRILTVALSYGGRSEILDAVNDLVDDTRTGKISGPITEDQFEQYLTTAELPDPDLLIRTSGEARISNFLLWQIAYTELYFTKVLWPDFRRREVLIALLDYQKRERRFGRVTQTASPQSGL